MFFFNVLEGRIGCFVQLCRFPPVLSKRQARSGPGRAVLGQVRLLQL